MEAGMTGTLAWKGGLIPSVCNVLYSGSSRARRTAGPILSIYVLDMTHMKQHSTEVLAGT